MSAQEIITTVSQAAQAHSSARLGGVSARLILQEAARVYGVDYAHLLGPTRYSRIANVRHRAWWVARQVVPHVSTTLLGKLTGGRDHSTVLHGLAAVERRLEGPGADAERVALGSLISAVQQNGCFAAQSTLAALELRLADFRAELAELERRVAILRQLETGHD